MKKAVLVVGGIIAALFAGGLVATIIGEGRQHQAFVKRQPVRRTWRP